LRTEGQQQRCALCGRIIEASAIKQELGGTDYIVDKEQCAILLKRFYSVYGNDFCLMLKEKTTA
jgi:hypothetical protein